jgi:hypothetical protein
MPYMNLRAVPQPSDPDEDELRQAAYEARIHVRFNGPAKRAGRPHIELFAHGEPHTPVATFTRARQALVWLEGKL